MCAQLNLSGNELCKGKGLFGRQKTMMSGIKALAKALQTNGSLTSVDLSRNHGRNGLGPAGAKALVEGGAFTGSLTSLNLASNHLGETGYVKASEVQGSSFKVGDKVLYQGREMVVSREIDDVGEIKMADTSGIIAIAEALRVCGSLTSLR